MAPEPLPAERRRILVIDGGPLDPATSAGARSTVDLMVGLRTLGADVRFLPMGIKGERDEDELGGLEARGIVAYRAHQRPVDQVLDDDPVDVVVANRPGPAALALGPLDRHPEVLRVYWGHDIHARRLAAQHAIRGDAGGYPTRATALAERRCWDGYDLTVYPTEHEAWAASSAGARAIACPYYLLEGEDRPLQPPGRAHRRGLLMVGGAAHAPNRDAVEWTAAELLPLLRQDDPTVEVTVVGDWPDHLVGGLMRPGLRFTGLVDEHDLRALHHAAVCLLAPLRFGSGSRRKLVGAMGLGLPVVTTSEGQEGVLVRDGRGWADGLSIADDPAGLAAAVRDLSNDHSRWAVAAGRGASRAGDVYGAEGFLAGLREVFTSLRSAAERP